MMKRFLLDQSKREFYTSHSGLALVGLCLNRFTSLGKSLQAAIPLRHGIAHSDVIKSYVGQMCLGKSDFEAVENVRKDRFFKESLGVDHVPSAARLRQRLDEHADALLPVLYETGIEFLVKAQVPVTALSNGYVALDIDVFPRQITQGPARKGFRGPTTGSMVMRRSRPIWARKAGAWRASYGRASSIVRTNFCTRWSGCCRMRES
jgi:hypothetical protein